MLWSETTCATITHLERSKGVKVALVYYRNGQLIKDRVDISYFKFKNLNDLQRKECCSIKYSVLWPYEIEITDKDLRAD
jgi:hypothetical protein